MSENEEIKGWFAGRIPDAWFGGPPEVRLDRDEILVVGTLPLPKSEDSASQQAVAAAAQGRIKQFREETRGERIRIAREAERRFDRKVSWGAICGEIRTYFTTFSTPMMTRLHLEEREVLDALVDAGVARSRSHALAWCVKLVRNHQGEWIEELREALKHVEKARAAGPTVS